MKILVGGPLYLLKSTENCGDCGRKENVVALATRNLVKMDDDSEPREAGQRLMLTWVEEMPEQVFEAVRQINPFYQKRHTKSGGAYYGNTCPACGASFGDWYLQSEPGGAFFPMDEEEPSKITSQELALEGTFSFVCGGVGCSSGLRF